MIAVCNPQYFLWQCLWIDRLASFSPTVLLYAKQENEEVFHPLHLVPPTLVGLALAVSPVLLLLLLFERGRSISNVLMDICHCHFFRLKTSTNWRRKTFATFTSVARRGMSNSFVVWFINTLTKSTPISSQRHSTNGRRHGEALLARGHRPPRGAPDWHWNARHYPGGVRRLLSSVNRTKNRNTKSKHTRRTFSLSHYFSHWTEHTRTLPMLLLLLPYFVAGSQFTLKRNQSSIWCTLHFQAAAPAQNALLSPFCLIPFPPVSLLFTFILFRILVPYPPSSTPP